ncbi:MAG: cytochrome c [Inquilinus sp.]|nr:cytochrome c [Inquilinus sp.]
MWWNEGFGVVLGVALATAALTALPSPAAAQGSERGGRAIAARWCVECHLIGPDGPGSAIGRPFTTIANDTGLTDDRLRGWLAEPHPPMPNLDLTRQEIENVIAYLESLKAR